MMKFDLCFTLIDLPDGPNLEWYRAAAVMMIASARRAYAQHDMRIVQISDGATSFVDGIDRLFTPEPKVERDRLMQYRGQCMADWALQTDRPTIFCDVDLLWNTDGLLGCFEDRVEPQYRGQNPPLGHLPPPGIVLTTRPNKLQPFNGGLVLTQPGQTAFWTEYAAMMKSLPEDIRGWWGDQLAFAVMLGAPNGIAGIRKYDTSVAYLPASLVCPSPKEVPTKLIETPAIHMKGNKRKGWLADYFMMLMQKEAA